MNQYVPDWSSNMGDAFAPLGGEDDGLMELLWCNGNVIMQSQAPRKPARPEKPAMQEDDAVSWFQCPADDPLDKDLFSEMFGEMPDAGKACKEEEECGAAVLMPPPPRPAEVPWEKPGFGEVVEGTAATETDESSMVTVGSRSICGSNKFQTPGAARACVVSDINDGNALPPLGGGKATAARGHHDVSTVTSSSMRSRPCFAKTEQHGTSNLSGGKRKQRDTMEPRSSIEDVEFESAAETREPTQKVTTTKRRRAAEVHNLSERRRRDRINEKMKALQQLIPHSNKTDKASMLDEAIEYLKSLQLQVQMMWMGGGMTPAPMMFPAGVHQYMQRMGVGMGAPHLASLPSMPPFVASMGVQSSPASHLPAAVSMADTYARCLSVQRLQPPSPMYLQGMSVYQLGAAKNLHQKSRIQPRHRLPAATARALPPDDVLHRKYENCSIPEEMMLISS